MCSRSWIQRGFGQIVFLSHKDWIALQGFSVFAVLPFSFTFLWVQTHFFVFTLHHHLKFQLMASLQTPLQSLIGCHINHWLSNSIGIRVRVVAAKGFLIQPDYLLLTENTHETECVFCWSEPWRQAARQLSTLLFLLWNSSSNGKASLP